MCCTIQNIAPQLLQLAGGRFDVILERETASMSDEANKNRRLHEEDILEHLWPDTRIKWLFYRLLRC